MATQQTKHAVVGDGPRANPAGQVMVHPNVYRPTVHRRYSLVSANAMIMDESTPASEGSTNRRGAGPNFTPATLGTATTAQPAASPLADRKSVV